jgi:hypothetical protein
MIERLSIYNGDRFVNARPATIKKVSSSTHCAGEAGQSPALVRNRSQRV